MTSFTAEAHSRGYLLWRNLAKIVSKSCFLMGGKLILKAGLCLGNENEPILEKGALELIRLLLEASSLAHVLLEQLQSEDCTKSGTSKAAAATEKKRQQIAIESCLLLRKPPFV
ncbi:hypothetical protein HAX54_014364 [Datura stramonium]|uniref:Uncharacterized protein n=1 Tax=Datura stramonium TaxID=4076 RepID=A0ABS8TQZ6_DATST|nr:hypothetical protein [Datura stramonium]